MKDNKKESYFPDPLASDEEKMSEEYALAFARLIQQEWLSNSEGLNDSKFQSQRERFNTRRKYARGEHSTDNHKSWIIGGASSQETIQGTDSSYTYSNFDFRPIKVLPKFIRLVIEKAKQRLFNLKVEAIDKYSVDIRAEHKKTLEDAMVSRDTMMRAKELLGADLMGGSESGIAESQEEIDLYMDLEFKLPIEMAAEKVIKYTMNLNDFDETQTHFLNDLITLGVSGFQHSTENGKGIILEYADAADMIHSFTENRNFEKVYYYGHLKRLTIHDIKRMSGDKFTDSELKDMTYSNSEWANTFWGYSNTRTFRNNDLDDTMVDVLDFTFKTTLSRKHKKSYNRNGNGYKMKPYKGDKKVGKYRGYDIVDKPCEVWFEGSYVVNTDVILKYGICENMVNEQGLKNRIMPPFCMYAPEPYKGNFKSLVDDAIQYVDLLQQVWIKMQQFVAKARPQGVAIDIDGINEILLDENTNLDFIELLKIYDETGNVVYTSRASEGGITNRNIPIVELNNGNLAGIETLANQFNFYLDKLRETLGIPQGADATSPHQDTLVGVQQSVNQNSEYSTNHILRGALYLTKKAGLATLLRLKDVFEFDSMRKAYGQAIGDKSMDILKIFKNFSTAELGLSVELRPDPIEKQYVENLIQLALQRDQIKVSDAWEIRSIDNPKFQNQLLKIRIRKVDETKRAHEEHMAKVNAQSNMEASAKSSELKLQEIEAQKQADLAVVQETTNQKVVVLQTEASEKKELMALEFEYNMQLKGIEVDSRQRLDMAKEKEKMRRQDRNNSQQSQIADQKSKDKKPLNFESSEDNLSNQIELSDIGPK